MAVDFNQLQQQDADFFKQASATRQAEQDKQAQPAEPSFLQKWVTGPVGRITTSAVDGAVSAADSMYETQPMRKARDAVAGAITGGVNEVDAAKYVGGKAADVAGAAGDPEALAAGAALKFASPIWDHAKQHILDFRDSVAVTDPTWVDSSVQALGQFAVPFAGYSRAMAGLHGAANMLAAGAATDATANAANAPREATADLLALGRHAEGKLGAALSAANPAGHALNAYVNFLADNSTGTEAEARFKQALDGVVPNMMLTPLLHAGGVVLKQGTAGLRYLADNGVRNTLSDLAPAMKTPGGPAAQAGKIGYHGTPNPAFNEFDNSKIGSGQGAQSFGYGHYIAENAETGETYQKSLSGRMNNSTALTAAQGAITAANGDKVKAFQELTSQAAAEKDPKARAGLQSAARVIQSGNADAGKGSLLKVDIDDKHIENMLDLDKPLADQPGVLRKIPMKDQKQLQGMLDEHGQDLELSELTGNEFRQLVERTVSENALPASAVNDGNVPRQASEYLSNQGIPGNKYFDRKSRVTGEGTRNYVVFDGKHIKVLGQGK